jgi:hypothetical protein
MTITGQPAISLLDSFLQAQSTNVDIGVAVLKKANDAMTQQGEALVKMLEAAAPPPSGQKLDTYA